MGRFNFNNRIREKASNYSKGKFFLFGFLVCFYTPVFCQVNITGEVVSENEEPIPYANVLLLAPEDSSLIKGTNTNEAGDFTLNAQPDSYLINITSVGYHPHYSGIIEASPENNPINLETLTLSEDVQQLQEVEVRGRKPLFEKHPDKVVVNVQSRLTSAGSSVLEVLEKSPGVNVNRQSNSISLQGKSGVSVMINGKINRMPLEAVIQMLDGMSANNTEKIELITSPPAKYEAEGNAGLINIVTKKNPDLGTNGNYGLTIGYNKWENLGGNFNLNHRKRRFNYFLDYNINYDNAVHRMTHTRSWDSKGGTRRVQTEQLRFPKILIQNLRAGMEYKFDNQTTASVLLSGFLRRWDMEAETNAYNTFPDSTIHTNMGLSAFNTPHYINGSIGLKHQINQGQEIKMNLDYLYRQSNNNHIYKNETFFDNAMVAQNQMDLDKTSPAYFRVGKVDYSNKLNEHLTLESGVKVTLSTLNNNIRVKRGNPGNKDIDPEFSFNTTLDENIYAIYGSWQWESSKNWVLNGGIRYEFTDKYLSNEEQTGLIDRAYGNFFPSLFLTRKFNKSQSIQASYNRRITRPTLWQLAPPHLFFGPDTFLGQNPELFPGIMDAVELTYNLRQWWIAVGYSYSGNEIATFQPTFNEQEDQMAFMSQNFKFRKTYSVNTTIPVFQITPWWELSNNLAIYYYFVETKHLEENFELDPVNFSFNVSNTIKLPKNFTVEVSGNYQSRPISGLTIYKNRGNLNLAIQKQLKADGGTFTLSFNDILETAVQPGIANIPTANLHTSMMYDYSPRSVSLSYTKRFGNQKLDKVNIESGSAEEKQRVR